MHISGHRNFLSTKPLNLGKHLFSMTRHKKRRVVYLSECRSNTVMMKKGKPKRKTRHVIFYTHAGYPWGHLSLAKAK